MESTPNGDQQPSPTPQQYLPFPQNFYDSPGKAIQSGFLIGIAMGIALWVILALFWPCLGYPLLRWWNRGLARRRAPGRM